MEVRRTMQKIVDDIKNIIQEVSGLDTEEIDSDCNLFSLGLDSLMLVQVKKKIDRQFEVELPVGRIMSDVDTIEKVAHFIQGDLETVTAVDGKEETEDVEVIGETVNSQVECKKTDVSDNVPVPDSMTRKNKPAENTFIDTCFPASQPKDFVENVQNTGADVQSIMEMQLKVMAQSIQNLAAKQLETIYHPTEQNNYIKPCNQEEKKEPVHRQEKANVVKKTKEIPQINFRAVKLEHDNFTPQQKAFVEAFIERYNKKTKRSKEYTRKNRKKFCDWIASLNFRMDFKELIYPIVSARSQGSKFWDLDGNQYLDMAIGYGVHYFGHRPQFIVEALQEQIAEGYETGPQTDLGGEVAELICKITGSERVAFTNTGSEAVMAALRIARTVTKKSKVVMFKGAYHGNFDAVLAETVEGETFPISPGTMPGMVEDVMVLEYAAEESLRLIEEQGDEIAAVIVEPVQSRNPSLQPKEFLQKLRILTQKIGSALIFDEMITGFRICPGGCQEYFGIRADLATYGKIAGGGMPIGIVAGKAEYLDAVDGGNWEYNDDSFPDKEMTYFAGTFCKHPLSLAASRAVLRFIDQDEGETQKRVNELTAYFVEQVNTYFEEENVPLRVSYFGSEFRFEPYGKYNLRKLPAETELFFYLLMEKGVYIWERRTCFFSAAHTYEDAQFFLRAIKESIVDIRNGGFAFAAEKLEKTKKKTR